MRCNCALPASQLYYLPHSEVHKDVSACASVLRRCAARRPDPFNRTHCHYSLHFREVPVRMTVAHPCTSNPAQLRKSNFETTTIGRGISPCPTALTARQRCRNLAGKPAALSSSAQSTVLPGLARPTEYCSHRRKDAVTKHGNIRGLSL